MRIKWDIDLVRKFVEENGDGDKLVSDVYVNSKSKLNFKCHVCGENFEIDLEHYRHILRHRNCSLYIRKIKTRHTIEFVKKYVIEHGDGDELLSEEYKNSKIKMDFRCHLCGKKFKMCFEKYRIGQRHNECMIKKSTETRRHSYDYIKTCIENMGCELISSKYNTTHDELNIRFSCGHMGKRSFYLFQNSEPICGKCKGVERYSHEEAKNYLSKLGFFYTRRSDL
jgi:hypothetical protein